MNYAEAAVKFFQTAEGAKLWKKYASKTLVQEVANGMKDMLPTVTAASIAFDRLVVRRTDGKTEADDRAEAHEMAKRGMEATIAMVSLEPLTASEVEYFASLSQFELSKLYWGPDNDGLTGFAVRYRKAAAELGYVIPPHYAAGGLR